jgi:hypothetical protein
MRFRLLAGIHIQQGPPSKQFPNGREEYFDARIEGQNVVDTSHLPTEAQDLCLHNGVGVAPKFERIHEIHPSGTYISPDPEPVESIDQQIATLQKKRSQMLMNSPKTVADAAKAGFNTAFTDSGKSPPSSAVSVQEYAAKIQKLNVKELQQLAEEEEVDLTGAKSKEEIVKLLVGNKAGSSLQPVGAR